MKKDNKIIDLGRARDALSKNKARRGDPFITLEFFRNPKTKETTYRLNKKESVSIKNSFIINCVYTALEDILIQNDDPIMVLECIERLTDSFLEYTEDEDGEESNDG